MRAVSKGNFTGDFVIYGYEIIYQKWTIKEGEAVNVRQMFADCAEGKKHCRVAQ